MLIQFLEITKKELILKLTQKETEIHSELGQTAWLATGLDLEEEQIVLGRYVKHLGPEPSLAQKLELAKMRQKLRARLSKFSDLSRQFLSEAAVDYLTSRNLTDRAIHWKSDDEDWLTGEPRFQIRRSPRDAECEEIPLPIIFIGSPIAVQKTIKEFQNLVMKEKELRGAQANDALQQIREDLSHLAWHYKARVRQAKSTKQVTRSWDGIHQLNRHWRSFRLIYCRAREQILCAVTEAVRNHLPPISAEAIVNKDYPLLTMADCQASAAVIDPNARNQSNKKLSWIWTANILSAQAPTVSDDKTDAYILECAYSDCLTNDILTCSIVYRLHWLRARARAHRWTAELKLTKHEMEWVVRFFMHMAQKWVTHRDARLNGARGLESFAEHQISMWNEFGRISEMTFRRLRDDYISIWRAQAHRPHVIAAAAYN